MPAGANARLSIVRALLQLSYISLRDQSQSSFPPHHHHNYYHNRFLTFSPSHLLAFSPSHLLTFSPSHLLASTPPHLHTSTPSHLHTISPPLTFSPPHPLTSTHLHTPLLTSTHLHTPPHNSHSASFLCCNTPTKANPRTRPRYSASFQRLSRFSLATSRARFLTTT
jgi:hypothetical protein